MAATAEDTQSYQVVLRGVDRDAGTLYNATFYLNNILPDRWPTYNVTCMGAFIPVTATGQIGVHMECRGAMEYSKASGSAATGSTATFGMMIAAGNFTTSSMNSTVNVSGTVANPNNSAIVITLTNLAVALPTVASTAMAAGGWVVILKFSPVTRTL